MTKFWNIYESNGASSCDNVGFLVDKEDIDKIEEEHQAALASKASSTLQVWCCLKMM